MAEIKSKKYKCRRCGFVKTISTNHYGTCTSWGRYNTCPKCPPWAKYPEFGGQTLWDCIEPEAETPKSEEEMRVWIEERDRVYKDCQRGAHEKSCP